MDINGKIWGVTSKLFSKSNVELFRIVGKLGGKSSMHTHKAKWSMFFVESGKLKVIVEKSDYELIDETILEAQQSMIIPPGEYHQFEILQDQTIAFELYWVELNTNDIVRRDCGSLKES